MENQEPQNNEAAAKNQEEQTVLAARLSDFVKEYGELVTRHKVDFATYPVYVPDGQGGFKVVVQNTPVDITNQPTKSPFVA